MGTLDEVCEKGDNKIKREIIGSIYPEKIVFDGDNFRTARFNEVVQLIYTLGNGFSEKEKGQTEENFDLSRSVPGTGIFKVPKRYTGIAFKLL